MGLLRKFSIASGLVLVVAALALFVSAEAQSPRSDSTGWTENAALEVTVLQGHTGNVNSAAFSPDGTRIITVNFDDTARVWDADDGEMIRTLEGHDGQRVWSAAFSRDGMRIVTASVDRTARVWDAETGEMIRTLEGHADKVSSVAFSPDGTRIVTASDDKTARVWSLR